MWPSQKSLVSLVCRCFAASQVSLWMVAIDVCSQLQSSWQLQDIGQVWMGWRMQQLWHHALDGGVCTRSAWRHWHSHRLRSLFRFRRLVWWQLTSEHFEKFSVKCVQEKTINCQVVISWCWSRNDHLRAWGACVGLGDLEAGTLNSKIVIACPDWMNQVSSCLVYLITNCQGIITHPWHKKKETRWYI